MLLPRVFLGYVYPVVCRQPTRTIIRVLTLRGARETAGWTRTFHVHGLAFIERL